MGAPRVKPSSKYSCKESFFSSEDSCRQSSQIESRRLGNDLQGVGLYSGNYQGEECDSNNEYQGLNHSVGFEFTQDWPMELNGRFAEHSLGA